MKAILVELDYKGCYQRFAMTEQEFKKVFFDAPLDATTDEGDTWTIRPLVHIWYKSNVEVGCDAWKTFFTDMEDGLPQSDVEDGNLAYVSFVSDWWEGELSLAPYANVDTCT